MSCVRTISLSNRLYCGMVYEFPELSDEMMVYEVLFEMREQQKTKMLLVEGFHFKEKEMHQPQPLGGRGGRRRSRDAPALGSSNSSPTIYVLYSCPCSLCIVAIWNISLVDAYTLYYWCGGSGFGVSELSMAD